MTSYSKDSTLDVESSGGNDNTHKTFDFIEVLTHSIIYVKVKETNTHCIENYAMGSNKIFCYFVILHPSALGMRPSNVHIGVTLHVLRCYDVLQNSQKYSYKVNW